MPSLPVTRAPVEIPPQSEFPLHDGLLVQGGFFRRTFRKPSSGHPHPVSSTLPAASQEPALPILSRVAAPLLFAATALLHAQTPAYDNPTDLPVQAQHAMVVTIQHDATDAGLAILQQGGNAVDAAVATAFALAVTYPQAGNLGGGGFMLLRMHAHDHGHRGPFHTHFLDYREKAPAAATKDMYLDAAGNVIPNASTVGYRASGVPGTVAGLVYAQSHFGRLTLAQDLAPAIRLANEGFVLSAAEAQNFANPILKLSPLATHLYQRDGNLLAAGDRLQQPLLASTLQEIATNPESFYRGPIATTLATEMQVGGGLITTADLAAYQVKERAPITGTWRGYKIISAPPPSSGGIVLVEILNILATYNLPKLGPDRSTPQIHLITEAFRRAYKDRADYLGDPDFSTLPLSQMASKKYAAAWRRTINPTLPTPSTSLVRPAGFLPPPPVAAPTPDHPNTTHFSIVDADGNAVASTTTLNNFYGSGVFLPTLGFFMNDEMDDFSSKSGVPNMFGLIQGPANNIGPGHRPLSAMTPTLVLGRRTLFHPHRHLRLVLGSPGGSTIITTVANDLISTLANGLNIQQAADAPRFHHQYLPDRLDLERTFPPTIAAQLAALGYRTNFQQAADGHLPGTWGDSELIAIDPHTHLLQGAHDNRRNYGKAAGY